MACICDLVKKQTICQVDTHQSVLEVVRVMVERNIGAVPVLEEGALVGVFSERDLMRRVVAEGRDPAQTNITEVMTREPFVVSPGESIETCLELMRRHGFRHLPICEGPRLAGMVSLRDLILHDLSAKDDEVRMMRAYIHSA
ncbi:MAG TPA: CBS domain-containing protein [Terriglobales bacterium]|nr:CBS domain-containing protein [Terriglobales bacterium]